MNAKEAVLALVNNELDAIPTARTLGDLLCVVDPEGGAALNNATDLVLNFLESLKSGVEALPDEPTGSLYVAGRKDMLNEVCEFIASLDSTEAEERVSVIFPGATFSAVDMIKYGGDLMEHLPEHIREHVQP